jgi:hypothetical protein
VVQVWSVTRVVEGSTHPLLVSFFVILEMFFLFKIMLFLKTRKRTIERNEPHEDGGCRFLVNDALKITEMVVTRTFSEWEKQLQKKSLSLQVSDERHSNNNRSYPG